MSRTLKLLIGVLATGAAVAGTALAASSPAVSTGSASSINLHGATLHGTINPNGAVTAYRFEWGVTNAYGASSSVKSLAAGSKAVSVSRGATGLSPGTIYHYRLVALNKAGAAVGADHRFKTAGHPPPGAVTGPISQLGPNFATVTGVVYPNGEVTRWWVRYGLTPFYGVQTVTQVIPAGKAPVPVSIQLQGLSSATFFHYQLVAQHSTSGPEPGADGIFLTFPSPRPVPRVPARTSPRHARRAPYVFTTSGRVTRPAWIPQSLACFQNATVRFYSGRRQVAFSLFPINPDCTFSGQTVFRHLPGHSRRRHRQVRLKVLIHFRGNGYLAPADARPESIVLG
jgi:hypothetical protein